MKVMKLDDFTRGWFVGNFEPAMYKTSQFEAGVLIHKAGESWPAHYHTGVEINCLLAGTIKMHNMILEPGTVFMIEPFEVADPEFLTDCVVVVVKTPSVPGDKYEAQRPIYTESK